MQTTNARIMSHEEIDQCLSEAYPMGRGINIDPYSGYRYRFFPLWDSHCYLELRTPEIREDFFIDRVLQQIGFHAQFRQEKRQHMADGISNLFHERFSVDECRRLYRLSSQIRERLTLDNAGRLLREAITLDELNRAELESAFDCPVFFRRDSSDLSDYAVIEGVKIQLLPIGYCGKNAIRAQLLAHFSYELRADRRMPEEKRQMLMDGIRRYVGINFTEEDLLRLSSVVGCCKKNHSRIDYIIEGLNEGAFCLKDLCQSKHWSVTHLWDRPVPAQWFGAKAAS